MTADEKGALSRQMHQQRAQRHLGGGDSAAPMSESHALVPLNTPQQKGGGSSAQSGLMRSMLQDVRKQCNLLEERLQKQRESEQVRALRGAWGGTGAGWEWMSTAWCTAHGTRTCYRSAAAIAAPMRHVSVRPIRAASCEWQRPLGQDGPVVSK